MRISTGLILCAGFGKRVAPLTNTTPKPLLQIKNVTLLENSINFLKKCGIKKIKINTHYLSDEIENFIKKKNYKNEVELFFEKEILDTGGGIKNLANNDTDENFLIINPDTIWKDNYLIEVEKMKKFYFDNNLSNILMLVNKSKSFDKRFKGDFTLKDNLVSKENINNYIFTGCQILNKSIFSSINKDKFSISEVWDKEINLKQLYGIESVNEFLHVTDLDIYKKMCKTECTFLFKNYRAIFNKLVDGELELNVMLLLINTLRKIENGQIDQSEGSVEVGKILKQIYIDKVIVDEPKNDHNNISWKTYKNMIN